MRITLTSGTEAEVARPAGDARMGLVVAPDIYGLRPLYEDICRRLADEWDMVTIAVEPFPGQDLGPDLDPRYAAVPSKFDMDALRDLVEAADETACDRVGLIGFCMGGMYAFKAAGLRRFDRIASFYGMIRVPEAWQGAGQEEPLQYLARPGASPVLAIIGEKDHYTPPDDVAELEKLANVTAVVYPDAEHGFVHDPSRPAHRPADAQDAWDRALAFLTS
jgi:carboxymethylenebutenolidase